ncbi:MAG: VOC family protein [Candidatus Cloacimonetes bacterium]|nr:VOC family protein [Candidatus Cloacimonadota bacterium]
MPTVNIYLNFAGNCREAFEFYRLVFGGEFPYVGTFGDMPVHEGMPPLPENMKDQIMHISLPISSETMLMGSDAGGEWAPTLKVGNNFSIYVGAGDTAEADRIFAALGAGGTVTMPLGKTFWGEYYGMLTDKFGINWMVGCALEEV